MIRKCPFPLGVGAGGDDPSWDKASNLSLSPRPSLVSGLLWNPSISGHLSKSFPVYCPKTGYDSVNKGGPPRPSSEQHTNKYSSPCLSNVTVSHLSLLPAHGSVILLALDLHLLSGASVPFASLPTTQLSLSPLSAPLCPIFLKDLAPTSPQRYPFVPGNKEIFGGSRGMAPEATGWYPVSPNPYLYLGFNCISPHFSSTAHLPSFFTGRDILFLIQNAFLLISAPQNFQRPLLPVGLLALVDLLALLSFMAFQPPPLPSFPT